MVAAHGAEPTLWSHRRSNGVHGVSVPRLSLLKLNIPSYPSDNCPLCNEHIPIVKPEAAP